MKELPPEIIYSLVLYEFGEKQEALYRESMQSVSERLVFARYHLSEVKRLWKQFEKKHLEEYASLLEFTSIGKEVDEAAFQSCMTKAKAHSVAAVQSLHSIPDIFSHAIYFASGQNLKPNPLAEREISIGTVSRRLRDDPDFAVLAEPLLQLTSGHPWEHLAAVSNTSKHRSVVRAVYSEDYTGARRDRRELQVSSFSHMGKQYPPVSIRDLVVPAHDGLMHSIFSVRDKLIVCLRFRNTKGNAEEVSLQCQSRPTVD